MVDTYGACAGNAQYILEYHVNVQINKIPQLVMQHERDGGIISQGIGRGVSQTP